MPKAMRAKDEYDFLEKSLELYIFLEDKSYSINIVDYTIKLVNGKYYYTFNLKESALPFNLLKFNDPHLSFIIKEIERVDINALGKSGVAWGRGGEIDDGNIIRKNQSIFTASLEDLKLSYSGNSFIQFLAKEFIELDVNYDSSNDAELMRLIRISIFKEANKSEK